MGNRTGALFFRTSSKEFAKFFSITNGSLIELDTQLEISHNLLFLNNEQRQEIYLKIESITSKLAGLINHVKRKVAEK